MKVYSTSGERGDLPHSMYWSAHPKLVVQGLAPHNYLFALPIHWNVKIVVQYVLY